MSHISSVSHWFTVRNVVKVVAGSVLLATLLACPALAAPVALGVATRGGMSLSSLSSSTPALTTLSNWAVSEAAASIDTNESQTVDWVTRAASRGTASRKTRPRSRRTRSAASSRTTAPSRRARETASSKTVSSSNNTTLLNTQEILPINKKHEMKSYIDCYLNRQFNTTQSPHYKNHTSEYLNQLRNSYRTFMVKWIDEGKIEFLNCTLKVLQSTLKPSRSSPISPIRKDSRGNGLLAISALVFVSMNALLVAILLNKLRPYNVGISRAHGIELSYL